MEENKLYMELAKSYYATTILYDDTLEYKRLIDRVVYEQNYGTLGSTLKNFFVSVLPASRFKIKDLTLFGNLDRCYSFGIENLAKKRKGHIYDTIICVSILSSFYCIYERETIIGYDTKGKRNGQTYNLNLDHLSYLDVHLLNEIKEFLSGLNFLEVKGEDLTHPMPYFYMCGLTPENFTLFQVLFKDMMEVI